MPVIRAPPTVSPSPKPSPPTLFSPLPPQLLKGHTMKDRRDRMLLIYALLTHMDEARASSRECSHHFLEHRMRSNWKVVEHILVKAVANGWVEADPEGRAYLITDQGRAFRALLEKAIAPIYTDYLDRK